MQHSSSCKIISRLSLILAISITLLGILSTSIRVTGDDYPNDKTQFYPFWNTKVTGVSWSNFSQTFISCSWVDLNLNLEFGLIRKSTLTTDKNFAFVHETAIPVPSGYTIDNAVFANPSAIYLDNGTIILVLIMHQNGYASQYNGVFAMNSTNNGSSWNAPMYLNVPYTYTVQYSRLIALNSSTFAVFWEENNSLNYRISSNLGYTWNPIKKLIADTSPFNFCYRNDGSITLITYLSSVYPFALELPKNPANWSQVAPYQLNYEIGTGSDTYATWTGILTFQSNRYLYNTGTSNIIYYDRVMNKSSNIYNMQFNSTGAWIVAMFKVDSNHFIVFFNDNGNQQCYILFASPFDPFAQGFPPQLTFAIVIVAIIGSQVILLWYSKQRKKRQAAQGQPATSSQSEEIPFGTEISTENAPNVEESTEDASKTEEPSESTANEEESE
ncbi:MAG TPA: sialidase family protein [Candidatus Lokiarchaeia archaeon]|nr:sialidase family protein [Candidatus Lokiarchaeia archaeon]